MKTEPAALSAAKPKNKPKRKVRRFSIAQRLYFVVGIMGLLIVLELATLRFAMVKLSAVRAFVGGESLWSKAQKNAVFSLQRYASTHDERDYQSYENYLAIPEGDHIARLAMFQPNPDLEVVRRGFLQGKIHPDDIDPMVDLLRRFYWVDQLQRAIEAWTKADESLEELKNAAVRFRSALHKKDKETARIELDRIRDLNEKLTPLEEDFSAALGDGSRFLEHVVFFLLTLAVIMVESVGLGLAFFTARSISRGLKTLNVAAQQVGEGNFEIQALPRTRDEIGELAESLEQMAWLLKKSYGELESRVQLRTSDLTKLAEENAKLYSEAAHALSRRDEFLSLASHELKTPLTSMLLQTQMLLKKQGKLADEAKLSSFMPFMERQLLRLNLLVEEMLDTSRIDLSKLVLNREQGNLSELVAEVCTRFKPQYQQSHVPLELNIEPEIFAAFDSYRLEQVIINLLTNALKYGQGKLVRVSLSRKESNAVIEVSDEGPGVAVEDRERIFGRFERGVKPNQISGLGIGLYIARAITEAHDGKIYLRDSQIGARFVVEIPTELKGHVFNPLTGVEFSTRPHSGPSAAQPPS